MLTRILTDETDQMDFEGGIWKSLVFSPPHEIDESTYEINGPTERYDCRDHCFARIAMKEGTPPYEDYYQRHPEKYEIDDEIRKRAQKSAEKLVKNDPINERLSVSSFSRSWVMSRPDYLRHRANIKLVPVGRIQQEKVYPDPGQMTKK